MPNTPSFTRAGSFVVAICRGSPFWRGQHCTETVEAEGRFPDPFGRWSLKESGIFRYGFKRTKYLKTVIRRDKKEKKQNKAKINKTNENKLLVGNSLFL